MRPLILASTSPYRRALLERLGVPFSCQSPDVDEREVQDSGLAPREIATVLAEHKARAIEASEDAVIIGSDQVCALGQEILHKPGEISRAREQLRRLSGREHRLFTSICVLHDDRAENHTDTTVLRMRTLAEKTIESYLRLDSPFDCAGSYKLEEHGISLFESIESDDQTAIVGMPLLALGRMLREIGFLFPECG